MSITLFEFVESIGMTKDLKNEDVSMVTLIDGKSRQYKNSRGYLHNPNGPAWIKADGATEWWLNGVRHRADGPAVEEPDGHKEWYMDGAIHRSGGPAIVRSCGDKLWYFNGKPHREDGPAAEFSDGSRKWYINGNLHREDGPAIEKKSSVNGKFLQEWYWEGTRSSGPEVRWRVLEKRLLTTPPKMGVELKQLFAINGMVHNLTGPARVWENGMLEWFEYGKRHRIAGPAVTFSNGEEYYYLQGSLLNKEEYFTRLNSVRPPEKKIMENTAPPCTAIVPSVKDDYDGAEDLSCASVDNTKIKQWPDDPSEIILYKDIYHPFKNILDKGYRIIRKNEWKFEYHGYEIGKQEKKIFPNAKEQLSEKFLRKEKDKYSSTLLDVVMRLLFLMGVEQGRRMAYKEQTPVRVLEKTLATYREKNKSVRYQLARSNAILKVREENPNLPSEEMDKLIKLELEKTRQDRIDEIKKDLRLDPTLNCFKSKIKKKTKLADLLALASTLDSEIFKLSDWMGVLEEANCSISEWKCFCKKHKFNKFIG